LSLSLLDACFLQQQNYWGPQCNQGPIVAFNLKWADGSWVGYHEVEKLAALSNILLHVSCFQDATSSSKQAICKRK
jgi:molybdenum cofactor sulfurtransferase